MFMNSFKAYLLSLVLVKMLFPLMIFKPLASFMFLYLQMMTRPAGLRALRVNFLLLRHCSSYGHTILPYYLRSMFDTRPFRNMLAFSCGSCYSIKCLWPKVYSARGFIWLLDVQVATKMLRILSMSLFLVTFLPVFGVTSMVFLDFCSVPTLFNRGAMNGG